VVIEVKVKGLVAIIVHVKVTGSTVKSGKSESGRYQSSD
jgi:hypothetical protein